MFDVPYASARVCRASSHFRRRCEARAAPSSQASTQPPSQPGAVLVFDVLATLVRPDRRYEVRGERSRRCRTTKRAAARSHTIATPLKRTAGEAAGSNATEMSETAMRRAGSRQAGTSMAQVLRLSQLAARMTVVARGMKRFRRDHALAMWPEGAVPVVDSVPESIRAGVCVG